LEIDGFSVGGLINRCNGAVDRAIRSTTLGGCIPSRFAQCDSRHGLADGRYRDAAAELRGRAISFRNRLRPCGGCATTPEAQNIAAAPAPNTIHKRERFISRLTSNTRTLSRTILTQYRTRPHRTIVSGSGTANGFDTLGAIVRVEIDACTSEDSISIS
jgi:hypothetical protein